MSIYNHLCASLALNVVSATQIFFFLNEEYSCYFPGVRKWLWSVFALDATISFIFKNLNFFLNDRVFPFLRCIINYSPFRSRKH